MKKKDLEKSMDIILANLRNASHISATSIAEVEKDIQRIQGTMLVTPDDLLKMQTIIDEYQKFSESAAMVSKQFKDFKNEIENKGEKQEC
ncbi:MAG: hypothetical protein L6276_11620 [Acetobacterium sp.]|nr:hypothetical protein [Acetobacterium sp.]